MRPPTPLVLFVLGAPTLAPALRAQPVFAEALPDPAIPAFHFPANEATPTRWVTGSRRGVTPDTRDAATAALVEIDEGPGARPELSALGTAARIVG